MKTKNVDVLLKRALKSTETPKRELIQKVKYEYLKEDNISMNKTVKRSFGAMVAVVMVVVILGTTAFAAWYFLKPSEVADKFENTALSAAFESETAININETIISGNYRFTLLAAVAGKDLTSMPYYNNDEIKSDRMYAVVAVQKADGTPMPSIQDSAYDDVSFFSSPLIKGIKPTMTNVPGMNGGGCSTLAIDGVLYRIVECDNVAMFADKGLYFAINTGLFFSIDAFIYNEQTGEITANKDYDGASVIFDLPIDKKYADPAKAEQYWKDQEAQANNDTEVESTDLFEGVNWETAIPVEKTIKKLVVGSDNTIIFSFDFEHGSGTVTVQYADHFSNDKIEQTSTVNMMANDDVIYAIRLVKDVNRTITGMIVMPVQ